MGAKSSIRFIPTEKSPFFSTLHSRVEAYFKEHGITRHANGSVVFKVFAMLALYLGPFVLLMVLQPSFGWAMLLWTLMGVGMAGVGMSIMHDANHGAFSKYQWVNDLIGYTLFMLGGSVDNWKMQHNHLHHNFTNIAFYDEDIADKPGLRLSPHTELRPVHKYQWLHAIFIYSLVTLYWVTAKDFLQYARYKHLDVNKKTPAESRLFLLKIVLVKIGYFAVVIGLPLMVGLSFWPVLAGFLLMHAVGGIILTVIFQLAHSVEETQFPQPNNSGIVEQDWAIHQLSTTVNFSRRNRLLSWYVGGLNFQVEHHLFPKICHVHYPRIADIVQRTALEYNVPYLEHKSFWHALRSHFATLRRFGMPHMDEMMG
jgi:linoleoyl-CoA desaturase